jgi:hypothetical protein
MDLVDVGLVLVSLEKLEGGAGVVQQHPYSLTKIFLSRLRVSSGGMCSRQGATETEGLYVARLVTAWYHPRN